MTYKTTIIRSSFWYYESKRTVNLILKGLSKTQINKITTEDNTFQVNTVTRSKNISNTTYNRMSVFPKEILEKFSDCDLSTAKILVLIGIMATDRLFYEFMDEIYREKKLLGYEYLTKKDLDKFFETKKIENEKVNQWSEEVIKRIKSTYFSLLRDSGLLSEDNKIKEIYFDYDIQNILINKGFQNFIEIIL